MADYVEENIEVVNFLEGESFLKVVQLEISGFYVMVFGAPWRETPHTLILEKFFDERKLPYSMKDIIDDDGDRVSVVDLDSGEGIWRAPGMGKVIIDKPQLDFGERSEHYKIPMDYCHFNQFESFFFDRGYNPRCFPYKGNKENKKKGK